MLPKFIVRNLNSMLYALAVTSGMYTAIVELHTYKNSVIFIFFSVLIFLIYFIEIFINWSNKNSKVEIHLGLHEDIDELSHLFHKIILPITLYISIIGFGFYNITNHSLVLILIFVFFIFLVLFINIRAFFQHQLTTEHKTHYIYDIIKFLIFFNFINVLSNISNGYNNQILLISSLVILLSFTIFFLMLWRHKTFTRKAGVFSILASIFIGIVFFILHINKIVNSLQISLVILFLFYLSAAIIHHSLMKTLTKSVLLEYLIVILLVLAITYGIS